MSKPERPSTVRHGAFGLRLVLRAGIMLGVVVSVLQTSILAPLLPREIANRFTLLGDPVGWIPTPQFLTIHLTIVATLAAIFIATPLALRLRARRGGAGARPVDEVCEFEERALLLGLTTMTFTVGLVHLVLTGNMTRPVHLGVAGPVLVSIYLCFTGAWAGRLIRRHRSRAATAAHAAASTAS